MSRYDRRWEVNGETWDSRLEYEIYKKAKDEGIPIRRTIKGKPDTSGSDTLAYWHPTRGGSCKACRSVEIGQLRQFTADLLYNSQVYSSGAGEEAPEDSRGERFYTEIKGYLRAPQRALLRSFVKARKDIDLRIIYQHDFRVTATSSISDWTRKCLKIPYAIWNGKWPTEWIMPNEQQKKQSNPAGAAKRAKDRPAGKRVSDRGRKNKGSGGSR